MYCIEPMKINKIPEGKEALFPSICNSGNYFAELKKDGYWYQYEKDAEGNTYLFSRNKSVTTGILTEKSACVPHIMAALNCLPKGTVIVGEIYYPNKHSWDVTPIMGSLPTLAIERQNGEYGFLHYYIHDILYYNETNLMKYGASIRYDVLKAVWIAHNLQEQGKGYLELAQRIDNNIQEAISQALENGEEGMVLKKKTAPYTPGKRPVWDTIKIKKTDTCDAICMGWNPPTKYYDGKLDIQPNYWGKDAKEWPYWVVEQRNWVDKSIISEHTVKIGGYEVIKGIDFGTMPVTKAYYYGWSTSMDIGAFDEEGKLVKIGSISSGLSEKEQSEKGHIGEVVELAGMEKNYEDKTLRHFHFKKFRDDKDAKDCTIKNIFG